MLIAGAKDMNRQPYCIWLTGLSGAGKSTLAIELEIYFRSTGRQCYILDGDKVREGLSRDLGYSAIDRSENNRRIAEVARLFINAGIIVIVALISPYKKERDFARTLFEKNQFIEIYVSTPINDCERRDTKGLYAKARNGEIEEFTGITSPYEPPINPEINIDTSKVCMSEAMSKIIRYIESL